MRRIVPLHFLFITLDERETLDRSFGM